MKAGRNWPELRTGVNKRCHYPDFNVRRSSSSLFQFICFFITLVQMASFRSTQRKPYSVSDPSMHSSHRLTRGATASFTRRRRLVATRQGSNGSSQDEKLCSSCANSTRSFPQQQARRLESSLRDNPKRPHSTPPIFFFSSSLKKKSQSIFGQIGTLIREPLLRVRHATELPLRNPKANLATCSLSLYLPSLSLHADTNFFLGHHKMK